MTEVFIYEDTDWDKLMHRMCVCGHELYMHSFTQHSSWDGKSTVLWVSQCINCPYDHEKEEFTCNEFRYA